MLFIIKHSVKVGIPRVQALIAVVEKGMKRLTLEILSHVFAVCRLAADEEIPPWVKKSPFFSITKTSEELSVVCEASCIPPGIKSEKEWGVIKVKGPLAFSLTGVLASL